MRMRITNLVPMFAVAAVVTLVLWSPPSHAQSPPGCEQSDSPCTCGYHFHDSIDEGESYEIHNCNTQGLLGGFNFFGRCSMNEGATLPTTPRNVVTCLAGVCEIETYFACGTARVSATLTNCLYSAGITADSIGARCTDADTGMEKICECRHSSRGATVHCD